MPTSLYNFQYVPLTGRLPGKSFVSQTEQAINGLAQYVYENSTNYEAVKAIAQKAEEDSSAALEYSEQALDKAQTALETVGRAYIKTTSAVDLDDYHDSELLLILSTESTNLPASISGYLTVMSSDTHDYCMQVYIGIDGSVYKRTATISNNTPTFGAWSETPITLSSLQTILADYAKVNASNIGVNAQSDNSVAWGNAIGGGEIAEDEQRLITGGTVYPLSQNVAENTSNIATNTADIVQNTGGISANSKRISNIEKLLQGNLYDYQTDTTSAYIKSVPSGAMPYAGLEKVGGKTVRIVNLVSNGNFASKAGWAENTGSTLAVSSNIATCNCDSDSSGKGIHSNTGAGFHLVNGHKYYVSAEVKVETEGLTVLLNVASSRANALNPGTNQISVTNDWVRSSRIATAGSYTSDSDYVLSFTTAEATACRFQVRNVMLIDLTDAYGAGNEPTSATHLDTVFTEFFLNQLASQKVTSVVSKDSSDNTLQTIPIPTAIRNLEGYGWSAGSVYNYIDFERKVFVQRVGRADLGDRNWFGGGKYDNITYFFCGIDNFNPRAKGNTNGLVCNKYPAAYVDKSINFRGINWGNQFNVFDNDYEGYTTAQFKAAMSGVIVYYELNTPVETDISEYLTDDNLINVEAGGTLTFENQNGDDYQIPVPSEEEYMIDLQASL